MISKILAIRNDRFGEFLLNIPAFRELKQNYPGAKLTLAVDAPVRQLAGRVNCVDEVIVWGGRKHTLAEITKFSGLLKEKKYDLCAIFNPGKESHIISFISGIPLRAGYDRKWGFLLNRRMEDRKSQGLKHEVEYNLELIKAIGVNTLSLRGSPPQAEDRSNLIDIKEDDFPDSRLAELGIKDRDVIAVHPWASNKEKEWPADKFRELVKRINSDLRVSVVLIGGQEETQRAEKFRAGLNVVNVTGKTTLIESAGLLKKARFLVTNDSGPMHLAAAAGTPVIAIFRKYPPAVSARRWGPVGNNHIIIENDDILRIGVEEVLDAIKRKIS
ncbi:glycosyltransferase family 9 protein [bacterium]|nr:MAG: glycosyltransferase family 9 protein [bacterium]